MSDFHEAALEMHLRRQAVEAVATAVRKYRFRFVAEDELQRGLLAAFEAEGLPAEPEARLTPRDCIDFLIGDIGVEVKVDGSAAEVERQLARYAASPLINSLVLITNCARHSKVKRELLGKPVAVIPAFRI